MCLVIVSTRKRSRLGLVSDTRGSRLGLVSDSLANVSVSSRSRELRSRSWSRSRPRRSWAHPWRLERSHGSFIEGTPAAERDLWMISFIIWCLAIFPSAVWHERPCKPERSTVSPHGQGCSSQSGKPSQSPTAILMIYIYIYIFIFGCNWGKWFLKIPSRFSSKAQRW